MLSYFFFFTEKLFNIKIFPSVARSLFQDTVMWLYDQSPVAYQNLNLVTKETHLFKLFSMLLWKLLQCTSLPNKCSAVVCKQLTLQKPLNLWTQFNRNVCIYEIKPFIDGRKVIYNLALVHYQGGFLHTCLLSDPICSLFFFQIQTKWPSAGAVVSQNEPITSCTICFYNEGKKKRLTCVILNTF